MRATSLSSSTGRVVVASIAASCLVAGAVTPASAAVVGTPSVSLAAQHTYLEEYGENYGYAPALISAVAGRTVVDVSVGNATATALLADGTLVVPDEYPTQATDSLVSRAAGRAIVDIESGYVTQFALLDDGSILTFGTDEFWDVNRLADSATAGRTFTDIAGSRHFAAALATDGDVIAWGDSSLPDSQDAIDAGIDGNAVAIDAGWNDVLVLLNDGSVRAFGSNSHSQNHPEAITDALGDREVAQIATTGSTHFALLADGSVVAWGYNAAGFDTQIASLIGEEAVASITADKDTRSLIAVLESGEVVAFSSNGADHPDLIAGIGDNQVTEIATGTYDAFAIVNEPLVEFSVNGQSLEDVTLADTEFVSVDAAALRPNAPYSLTWDGVTVAEGTTTGAGTVDTELDIPTATSAGSHTAALNVGESTWSAEVTVGAGLVSKTPIISGTPRVGEQLSIIRGKWSTGVTFTYSWLKNGVVISGATGATYTLKATDRGAYIQARVKGTKTGFTAKTVTSAKTAAIGYGVISNLYPYVSGENQVGEIVTVRLDATPTPGTLSYSYQWYANNVAITGATKASYRVAASLVNKNLTVRVVASKSGYKSQVRVAEAWFVEAGELSLGDNWVDGEFAPGKRLTVVSSGGTTGIAKSFQWVRDGWVIPGATASSYLVTSADLGTTIEVRVIGYKLGYYGESETIGGDTVRPALAAGSLKISGTAKVGNQLGASVTAPEGTSTLFVWVSVTAKGTETVVSFGSPTYTVTAGDKGKTLVAYAMLQKEGFANAYRQSAPTAVVI